jgi:ABC-type Fe3+-hydroxamate transport system substrate-binding protein
MIAQDQLSESQRLATLHEWQAHPVLGKIDAVRNAHLYVIGDSLLSIPGPRLAEAARRVAAALDKARLPLEQP